MLIRFLISNDIDTYCLDKNWYLLIHFSTGSKISSETWFTICIFSFVSKFETVFLKKVFNSLAISWSFRYNSFSSTSFICGQRFPLFEKKGFTVFQKSLLSFTSPLYKGGFKLLKSCFFSIKATEIVFFLFLIVF